MEKYHKIQSVFKRNDRGMMLFNEYSDPVFEYLSNNIWDFTEKVDGTNIRVSWDGSSVVLGGRTDNAQIPVFLVQRLSELFQTTSARQRLKQVFPDGCCLYGEGYGAKIQKGGGKYKADGVDFVLFDVRCGGWWLQRSDIEDIAKQLDISIVPLVARGTIKDLINIVKDGFNSKWGPFSAEGIVARPHVELQMRNGQRIITKLKHKDFNER